MYIYMICRLIANYRSSMRLPSVSIRCLIFTSCLRWEHGFFIRRLISTSSLRWEHELFLLWMMTRKMRLKRLSILSFLLFLLMEQKCILGPSLIHMSSEDLKKLFWVGWGSLDVNTASFLWFGVCVCFILQFIVSFLCKCQCKKLPLKV